MAQGKSNQGSVESAPSESAQRAIWRARFYFNVIATFALVSLFLAIFTGMARHELRDIPVYMTPDPPLDSLRELNWLIEPMHRYLSYALVLLLPLSGLLLMRLGRKLGTRLGSLMTVVGATTMLTGLAAVFVAIVTGFAVGDASGLGISADVMLDLQRERAGLPAKEALSEHLQWSAMALLLPAIAILVGVTLSSISSVKALAGLAAKHSKPDQ